MTTSKEFHVYDAEVLWDQEIKPMFTPFCDRLALAGSVRRMNKLLVKDIEVLVIPKYEVRPNLFGEPAESTDLLHAALEAWVGDGSIWEKRPNVQGHFSFGPKNKLLIHKRSGIPVDVFTADAQNWGMAMVVRTGPKGFNIAMMKRFQEHGMKGHAYGGVTTAGGVDVVCPDEQTVFDLLEWDYVAPIHRESHAKAYRQSIPYGYRS